MTSMKRLQKFHTYDVLLSRSGSASDWMKQIFNQSEACQMHYPDLGDDTSSVWNFCARSSDTSFRGKTNGDLGKGRLLSQANCGRFA